MARYTLENRLIIVRKCYQNNGFLSKKSSYYVCNSSNRGTVNSLSLHDKKTPHRRRNARNPDNIALRSSVAQDANVSVKRVIVKKLNFQE